MQSQFITDFSPHKRGLEIWQKYQHLFPSRSYAIVKTRAFFPDRMAAVFLIHKGRLLDVLKQNFIEFRKVFPQYETPENLLDALIDDISILQQICTYDYLLGMTLGFGRDNAALFARKWEIEGFLSSSASRKPERFNKPFIRPTPLSCFSTLEEELCNIKLKEDGVLKEEECPTLCMLHFPVGFLVDRTKTDLDSLRAQLKQEHARATQAYRERGFLEITLYELMR